MILAGGLNKQRATDLIERGLIDLAAFGQPYIANPDLVERLQRNIPLATPDRNTYFGEMLMGIRIIRRPPFPSRCPRWDGATLRPTPVVSCSIEILGECGH